MFNASDMTLLAGFNELPGSLTSKAFTADKIEFLAELSKRLLTYKDRPNVVALAYWLRKSNVVSIEREFEAKQKGEAKLKPAGLVFQIAPGNVDALFAYYWSLSMLLGNTTVTRLSASRGEDAELILDCLRKTLDEERFSSIKSQNSFIYYDHEITEYTQKLSLLSDRRVIWGGNKTVERIQRYPVKSTGKDIVFPDRQSIAVVRFDESWTDETTERFSKALKTDVTSLGQGACASPLAIVWLGDKSAIGAFFDQDWAKIEATLGFDNINSLVFLQHACVFSGEKISPSSVTFKERIPSFTQHKKSGFWHLLFPNPAQWDEGLLNSIQTIGFFNITSSDKECIQNYLAGSRGKRLTHLGRMLDFNTHWDGVDSIHVLSTGYGV